MKWLLILLITVVPFVYPSTDYDKITNTPAKKNSGLMLFAHRGIMNYYPENSTSSLNRARELNFNAVEIDIRKTKDDQFVLVHDETLERMTGEDVLVSDLTVAELKSKTLYFEGKQTTDTILTLDEVLENYKDDFIFYVDNKSKSLKDAKDLAKLIKKHNAQEYVIAACTRFYFTAYIELKYPEINTALEGFTPGKELFYELLPARVKPDFLASFAVDIDKDHIAWLEKNNLLDNRIAYYADETYEELIAQGVTKLIIDYDTTTNIADFVKEQQLHAEE